MSTTAELVALARDLKLACVRGARRIRFKDHPSLPAHHFSVLLCLSDHGPQCPTTLAAHDNVTTPSMTRTLNRLVDQGLAVRTPHPTDGRRYLVSITERGRDAVSQASNDTDDWIMSYLRTLDGDRLTVVRDAAVILTEMVSGNCPMEEA